VDTSVFPCGRSNDDRTRATYLLVSVVIPAYNAQRFLRMTLLSAQKQAYPHLEIIVIDDGSTDATSEIAESVARADKRVRVVHQRNAGVAAARNRGIAEARGDYVALLDADDLWHRQNVALQMEAMKAAGPETALSYAWYVSIDEYGRVLWDCPQYELRLRRQVFHKQIEGNFIGNGSCVLMRRSAVEAVGGYDMSLRARDAQGSEDHALYLALAERWNFAVVPEYLVAYRRHAECMSGDYVRMARSEALVIADLRRRRPDVSACRFGRGQASAYEELLRGAVRDREWNRLALVLSRASQESTWCFLDLVGRRLIKVAGRYCLRMVRRTIHRRRSCAFVPLRDDTELMPKTFLSGAQSLGSSGDN
jgi:glycosyltransferase involved in cell wall biosynthesis